MKHEARKTRTKAMKVNSFINKWIANGEISIALLEIAKER